MIKAVIYDFDGTLVNTLPLHLEACLYTLSKFGLNPTKSEVIEKFFNLPDDIVAQNFAITDTNAFAKYHQEGIQQAFKQIALYQGVITNLKTLLDYELKLGIASLTNMHLLQPLLYQLELAEYFEAVVGNQNQVKSESILEICRKLGVNTREIILIGDSVTDLQAAQILQSKSILFYSPELHKDFHSLDQLKTYQPDYIIKHHDEIPGIIRQLL